MVPGRLRGFDRQTMCEVLKSTGTNVSRYGLVIVLLWIGGMKFTAYEAEGIRPMVANSPLMGWAYKVMSEEAFSALLGVVEIATGLLIALRPVWPLGSAVGSGLAVGTFLTTLTFLFTTPGWEPSLGGFPALSAHARRVSAQGPRPAGSLTVHGRGALDSTPNQGILSQWS